MPFNFSNMISRKRAHLRTSLDGVNGFTGRGEISVAIWNTGTCILTVLLRGVAGRNADIFANETRLGSIRLVDGRAAAKIKLENDPNASALLQASSIEIKQNGDVILSGKLHQNNASRAVFTVLRDKLAFNQKRGEKSGV
ncbi:hypothetical protein PUV54_00790 [Hyphococcus flavus]|uniref:Uncharacterized protein n=1 Tax=Hyphococcus flavus TaxID=1866326 RepID=A0AAF0CFT5_9PROT|nr:hypothetical protein [Hyphococcus flavus]WDI31724.1 hypothetical protein PUV54_00790 [Hyphococcus flavus]